MVGTLVGTLRPYDVDVRVGNHGWKPPPLFSMLGHGRGLSKNTQFGDFGLIFDLTTGFLIFVSLDCPVCGYSKYQANMEFSRAAP